MAKRVFDIISSFCGLILLSPVLLGVALLIKIKMPGPILFCQKRVGRYGRLFTLYKFRTMLVNHSGSSVSVRGESRITPLGAKLRKLKLDELPELWNVLKGDMSLVGPRPDVSEYINRLVGDETHILDIRPGITSPASLKYANEEELIADAPEPAIFYNETVWPDKVSMNLDYYKHRSFVGDIFIILKTIFG